MGGSLARTLGTLAIGIGLGLLYGWVIRPAQPADVTPSILRVDYRSDYVLTVAEAYDRDRDAAIAAERLAVLGTQPPDRIALEALEFARRQSFTEPELRVLEELLTAMQTYRPEGD